jgi:CheY-like chemotaxis protein
MNMVAQNSGDLQQAGAKPSAMSDILVVEDNDVSLKYISNLLERAGYSFTVSTNGADAVEKLDRGAFKLVLMDMIMPIMNGFDATACIRKNPRLKTLPVVALTSLADEEVHCLSVGCNAVIVKPFSKDRVLDMISKMLPKAAKKSQTSAALLSASR